MNCLRLFQRSGGYVVMRRPIRRTLSTSAHTVPLVINGKDILTNESSDVTSPVTGKLAWSFSSAADSHVDEAIQKAQEAFPSWSRTKAAHRRDLFLAEIGRAHV